MEKVEEVAGALTKGKKGATEASVATGKGRWWKRGAKGALIGAATTLALTYGTGKLAEMDWSGKKKEEEGTVGQEEVGHKEEGEERQQSIDMKGKEGPLSKEVAHTMESETGGVDVGRMMGGGKIDKAVEKTTERVASQADRERSENRNERMKNTVVRSMGGRMVETPSGPKVQITVPGYFAQML